MFTEILNPFLNVRNKVKNRNGQWVDQQIPKERIFVEYGTNIEMSPTTDRVIFENWEHKVILDELEMKSTANAVLVLHVKPNGGNYANNLFFTLSGGTGTFFGSMQAIRNRGSGYLEYTEQSADGEAGTIRLKRPIEMPEGARLILRSDDEGTANYKVVFRTIEG